MQQGDQTGAAFVDDAEHLFDEHAHLPRRTRQGLRDVNHQFLFLRLGKKAGAASGFEAPQPFDASLIVGLAPASDRIVVEIKRLGGPLATPAVVKKQHGVGSSRQTLLGTAVTQKGDQLRALPGRKKTAANHA
jgi:hypothetical protein